MPKLSCADLAAGKQHQRAGIADLAATPSPQWEQVSPLLRPIGEIKRRTEVIGIFLNKAA